MTKDKRNTYATMAAITRDTIARLYNIHRNVESQKEKEEIKKAIEYLGFACDNLDTLYQRAEK